MPTLELVQAFLVGRDAYLVETLAYKGILDQTTSEFRLQIATAGSQVWADWLTVDAAGNVTIPSLTGGSSLPWSSITGTPTTLAGYGITSPLPVTQGGTGTATPFATNQVVFAGPGGVYTGSNALQWDGTSTFAIANGALTVSLLMDGASTFMAMASNDAAGFSTFLVQNDAFRSLSLSQFGSTGGNVSVLDATGDLLQITSQLGDIVFTDGINELMRLAIASGVFSVQAPLALKGYTVATLPAGVVGYVAYCTDLLAPAFLAVAVGGGAITGPVFYNGAAWVSI